ncbi:glutaredoxin family protein [Clostridium polynesiense]|uniref:glutaredoxin family protein n=1 Tax=Clostridium polynesiense TaxID=1325933 RepID=UPI00058C2608|nr:glutaredoxin family protein [Clostridium polynesiense]
MIKVYTTNSCPWCVKVKNYLKTNGVSYEELNVQEDTAARKEMFDKSKQMGVPVVDINGSIIVGFNKPAIDEALGL